MPETIIDLGKKVKAKYPGSYDDIPDADLGRKVKAKFPGSYDDFSDVTTAPAASSAPDSRSASQVLHDQFSNAMEGAGLDNLAAANRGKQGTLEAVGNSIYDTVAAANANPAKFGWDTLKSIIKAPVTIPAAAIPAAVRSGGNAVANAAGLVEALGGPKSPFETESPKQTAEAAKGAGQFAAAVPVIAGDVAAAKGGVNVLKNLIPSKEAAGQKFAQVAQQANPVPINAAAADDVALRAQELSTHGSTLPKVFRDYIRQRGNSVDMTYEEARDFAKNSGRLSAAESLATNPEMKMLAGKFYDALKTANRGAADSVGMGGVYDSAIKEFRRASNISDATDIAMKWAKIAAITGGVGATGAKLYKAIFGN